MVFMPFVALLLLLFSILSLAVVVGGGYIVWAWYIGVLSGTAFLIGGLAMVLFTFFGRFLLLPLLARSGSDEPKTVRDGSVTRLKRPDGTEIHVEQYGPSDAPALVLTHGWGLNSTIWYYLKEYLGQRYHLVLWDLPGLGKSSRAMNHDYSTERFAADLHAILELLGQKPVILIGHSIGGMTTLSFCRLFPESLATNVMGLALVNTTFTDPVATATFGPLLRALKLPILTPLMYLTILCSPLVWLMNGLSYLNGLLYIATILTGFAGTQTRGQLDVAAQYTLKASPAVLARGMLAAFKYNETDTLDSISIPALIVTGNQDRVTIPQASEYMHTAIKNSTLVPLAPAGHISLFEQGRQLATAIDDFAAVCIDPSAKLAAHKATAK